MAVEYWSEEELEEYYENPHLFIIRAKRLRSKMICELLQKFGNRIAKTITK